MTKQVSIIHSEQASKPHGHYSQAVEANGFIFTSVQLGFSEGINDQVGAQLRNALRSTEKILLSAGSSLQQVVRLTIYLRSISDWEEVNRIVAEIFGEHKPARGIIPVTDLHMGAHVAVDLIALKQ